MIMHSNFCKWKKYAQYNKYFYIFSAKIKIVQLNILNLILLEQIINHNFIQKETRERVKVE